MCPGQRMQLAARGLPLKAGTLQPALMLQGSALWAMSLLALPFCNSGFEQ